MDTAGDITHVVKTIAGNPDLVAKIIADGYKLYATRQSAEAAFLTTSQAPIVYFADLLMYGVGPDVGNPWTNPDGKPWGILDAKGFEYHIYGMNHGVMSLPGKDHPGCSMPDCVGCRCRIVAAKHSVADYCRHFLDDMNIEDHLEKFFAFTNLANNAMKDPIFAKVYASVDDMVSKLRNVSGETRDDLEQWLAELNSSMFVYECGTDNDSRLIMVVFAADLSRACKYAADEDENAELLFTLLDANFMRGYRDLVWKTIANDDIDDNTLVFHEGAGIWKGLMNNDSVEVLLARCDKVAAMVARGEIARKLVG